MAILEIKKYPDPILRKKCEEVKEITQEIKELVLRMTETMFKNQGIGLSAPQVGISKRIIVVATEKDSLGLINPKILKKSNETESLEEGCLSFPGLFLEIKRQKLLEIEALDINGKKIYLKPEEFLSKRSSATNRYLSGIILSRVIQHEIDHLNGILIIDKISFWQKLCQEVKIRLLSSNK